MKGFTDTTEKGLRKQLKDYYNKTFSFAEAAKMMNDLGVKQAQELRAYHATYTVDPVGVRERSDTSIKKEYPSKKK